MEVRMKSNMEQHKDLDRKKDILRKKDAEKKWEEEDEWAVQEKRRKELARQRRQRVETGWETVDCTTWAMQDFRSRLQQLAVESSCAGALAKKLSGKDACPVVAMVVDVKRIEGEFFVMRKVGAHRAYFDFNIKLEWEIAAGTVKDYRDTRALIMAADQRAPKYTLGDSVAACGSFKVRELVSEEIPP